MHCSLIDLKGVTQYDLKNTYPGYVCWACTADGTLLDSQVDRLGAKPRTPFDVTETGQANNKKEWCDPPIGRMKRVYGDDNNLVNCSEAPPTQPNCRR